MASETIGQRMRRLRSEAGLSPTFCAAAVGVSAMAWVHWEAGTRTPRGDRLPAIAEALGTTVYALLAGTQEVAAP